MAGLNFRSFVFFLLVSGRLIRESFGIEGLYAPTNFQADPNRVRDVSLLLTWSPVPKAAFYQIYIKPPTPTASGIGRKIETPYSLVQGLKPDTEYQFTIFAMHGETRSNPTVKVQRTALPAPTYASVVQDSLTHNSMTIRWAAIPEASYKISTQPSIGVIGTGSNIHGEERLLKGLSPNTQYTITIRGVNWVGDGAGTTIIQTTKLPPPQDLKVVKAMLSPKTIGVQWSKVPGAYNYVVTYSPSTTLPQTTDDTYVELRDLQPDTVYTVKVATNNVAGQSSFQSLTIRTLSECYLSAKDFSETSFGITCPAHCSRVKSRLYGTGEYTSDSYICIAAIHDGHIDSSVGGYVMVKKKDEMLFFVGTTRNGVTSETFQYPHQSFVFGLQPPKNVTIAGIVKYNEFVVQWSPVRGAAMYRITVLPNEGRSDILRPETKIVIKNLTPNVTYTVYVVATSSDESSEAAKVTQTTGLPSPTHLQVPPSSVNSTSFIINWQHVVGADSYVVSVKTDLKIYFRQTTKNNSVTAQGLIGGTVYNISVNAVNRNGIGQSLTLQQYTALSAPSDLSVAIVTSDSMKFFWSKVHGATNYKLSFSPCCHRAQVVEEQFYWLKNLTSNTEFTVKLVASNSINDSAPVIFKQRTGLGPPVGVKILPGTLTHSSAELTWRSLYGAITYLVIVNGKLDQKILVNQTKVLLQELKPDSNHTIVILGQNSIGDGVRTFFQFTTLLSPPQNVRIEHIQSLSTTLNLYWDKVNGISLYSLFCEPSINISGIGNHSVTPAILSGFKAGHIYNISLRALSGSKFSSNVTYILDTRKPDISLVAGCITTFDQFVIFWSSIKYRTTKVVLLSNKVILQNHIIGINKNEIFLQKPHLNMFQLQLHAAPKVFESGVTVQLILQNTIVIDESIKDNNFNFFWYPAFLPNNFKVILTTNGVSYNKSFDQARATFSLQGNRQYQKITHVNVHGQPNGMSLMIPSSFQGNNPNGFYPMPMEPNNELTTDDKIRTIEDGKLKSEASSQTWIVIVIVVGIIFVLFIIICAACVWETCWRKPLLSSSGLCGFLCSKKEKY